MAADAVMYNRKTYSGTSCAGDPTAEEWNTANVCYDMRSNNLGYLKLTCSGDDVVFTGYTDAGCSSVNTSFQISAHTGVEATAGVLKVNSWSTCTSGVGETESRKWSCANQPKQVNMGFFSDASCSTATTNDGGASEKVAFDVCTFETTSNGVESEMRTVSGNMMTYKSYSSKDCTGTINVQENILLNCTQKDSGSSVYWMQDASGVLTAAQAQANAAASSAPAPPPPSGNTTNTTAAPKSSTSGASLPYSIVAWVLSVVAGAAASI